MKKLFASLAITALVALPVAAQDLVSGSGCWRSRRCLRWCSRWRSRRRRMAHVGSCRWYCGATVAVAAAVVAAVVVAATQDDDATSTTTTTTTTTN